MSSVEQVLQHLITSQASCFAYLAAAAPGNEDAMKREAFDALGQERAVLEAAVSSCIYHPNVVRILKQNMRMKRQAFEALGQGLAVLEAAVTSYIYHPNVVTVYHYDISEVKGDDIASGLGGLQVHSHQAVRFWKLYLIQSLSTSAILKKACMQHQNKRIWRGDSIARTQSKVC
ncbi:hypothetical protein DUNSADRAFT_2301 [Dunaliella salina]|uniref:Uncharacterized protein n=1 Tax=Dunaliella salina TaxID=3046 RepID=A0ABQ7GVV8_DUNSA|nr:hypothetical protein DUNSADRAFT_2301 [Dunaliella salina]|eukprot:KAF5838757.1 hypothetical protein DUNSADRAFT_2301 [Dunaliella salina]